MNIHLGGTVMEHLLKYKGFVYSQSEMKKDGTIDVYCRKSQDNIISVATYLLPDRKWINPLPLSKPEQESCSYIINSMEHLITKISLNAESIGGMPWDVNELLKLIYATLKKYMYYHYAEAYLFFDDKEDVLDETDLDILVVLNCEEKDTKMYYPLLQDYADELREMLGVVVVFSYISKDLFDRFKNATKRYKEIYTQGINLKDWDKI